MQMRNMQPVSLVRNFTITGLVVVTLVAVALILFMRWISTEHLNQTGEINNVTQARWLSQELWAQHGSTFKTALNNKKNPHLPTVTIEHINEYLNNKLNATRILKVKIIALNGTVLYSTDPTETGNDSLSGAGFLQSKNGKVVSNFNFADKVYAREEMLFNRNIISSYIPVFNETGKDVMAIMEMYTDVTELVMAANKVRNYFIVAVFMAALIVLLVMTGFVMRAKRTIQSQHDEIAKLARFDNLTGLPNRILFYNKLVEILEKAKKEKDHVALMLIDIDHFKGINDKFGHSYGDELLKVVMTRIKKCLDGTYLLARLGDDEFAVLCERSVNKKEISKLATEILDKVQLPVTVDAEYVTPNICIGVSILHDDSQTLAELIQHADAALYQAKQMGGGQYKSYASCYGMRNLQVYELEYELTRAIEESEFVLYYQPKIDVTNGQIVGAEALMRWNSYTRGMVSPLDFIPVLEASGMIHQVGEWVIRQACELIKKWQDSEIDAIPVSVNVSAEQFKNPDFVSLVENILHQTGVNPELLELELTESCLMEDAEATLAVLNKLKKHGISISIDDFGTGYSSLSYLKRFPIDTLKIDRSFIHEINNRAGNDNAAIVTAIMSLSHSLRLSVIAEGVETAKELAYLNALGCKVIQGFLFSKPLPEAAFEAMLVDNAQVQSTLNEIRQQLA